jgi:uncharacterized iron-regulated protein
MDTEALVDALGFMSELLQQLSAKQAAQSHVISAVIARTLVSKVELDEFAESMTEKFDAAISKSEEPGSDSVRAAFRGEFDEIFVRALQMRRG